MNALTAFIVGAAFGLDCALVLWVWTDHRKRVC